jgi:hypothetical protein
MLQVWFMVFNSTFNNISVISWQSVLLVEETGENHQPVSAKLQIKFTFRSGPMIFGRVMALGLCNLAKYLVVTAFFRYAWRY